MTTFSSLALDLIWEGNAIGLVATRDRGWPTSIVLVPARSVSVRRVTETNGPLRLGAIEYQVGTLRGLSSNDVIHIKGPCEPGALRGLGVLEAHLNTLTLATELGRQARSISKNGVPTGLLKATSPDTTQAQMQAAKEAWLTAQRDRTVAALGPTADFVPLAWKPEEMQMIEARKFSLTEMELIFGLPSGWLGGSTSSRTYSNIEQDAVNLLKFSLGGHVGRFESTLSLHFPRNVTVRATLDAVLRSDTLTRYQAHQIALTAGFLTVDEVRAIEHRAPLPAPAPAPEPTSAPASAAPPDSNEGGADTPPMGGSQV